MKVYNAAHKLAQAIRENEDYLRFKTLHERLVNDEKHYDLFMEFVKKQEVFNALSEEEQSDLLVEELTSIVEKLNAVDYIKEYFELELKLNQMMSDITKILSQAIEIDY